MKKIMFVLTSAVLFSATHTALANSYTCPPVDAVKAVSFRMVYKLNGRWEFTSNRIDSNGKVWLVHFSTRLSENPIPIDDTKQARELGKAQFDKAVFYNPPHERNPVNNITCIYAENVEYSVVAVPAAIYRATD